MLNNEIINVFDEFISKITVGETSLWKKFLNKMVSCDDIQFHLPFEHSNKSTNCFNVFCC